MRPKRASASSAMRMRRAGCPRGSPGCGPGTRRRRDVGVGVAAVDRGRARRACRRPGSRRGRGSPRAGRRTSRRAGGRRTRPGAWRAAGTVARRWGWCPSACDYSITSLHRRATRIGGRRPLRPPPRRRTWCGARRSPGGRPCGAGHDVHVQVRDALADHVVHRHERARPRPSRPATAAATCCTSREQDVAGGVVEVAERHDVRRGHHERVPREQRPVVEERDHLGRVEHDRRRGLPRHDRAEEAGARSRAGHAGQSPGDVYGRRRAGAASRLGTITLRRKKHTSSPRWLNPRVSTVTTPRSGRLDDSRFSITFVSA